jgi:UDP-N-acetylglucosamine 3-dehydrogenase
MIRVGVVGLGAMGQHHARLYSKSKCKLVGVADIDQQRTLEIAEKYNVDSFGDYRELIGKVDAVSIAVPTSLHHKVAMDFLKKGVHCLVEKPIALTLREAQEMILLADQNHAHLAVGHIECFNPAVVKLKEIIDNGVLGKILIISTRRVGPSAPRIKDVGIVVDSATHDIGVIRYLLNSEPISVFSRVGNLRNGRDDHAIIVLSFYGPTACIEVNWFTPHKVRSLVATGSEGIAYLDYITQEVRICKDNKEDTLNISKVEPLKVEIDDFIQSILEGKKPRVDGREGWKILKVALESSKNDLCDLSKMRASWEDLLESNKSEIFASL